MPVTSKGSAIAGGAAGGYTGGTGNWGSGLSKTTGGGGGGGITTTKTTTQSQPQTSTTFKQQVFNIVCTGMKPNTIHKFYYEGVDRGIDCIPVYPKPTSTNVAPGSELKTDSEGKIEFNFYFTLDVEAQVDASNKTTFEVAGDKRFELRATDSSAYKIVPFTKVTNDLTSSSPYVSLTNLLAANRLR